MGDVILVRCKGKEKDKNYGPWLWNKYRLPSLPDVLEAETGLVKAMVGGRDFKANPV